MSRFSSEHRLDEPEFRELGHKAWFCHSPWARLKLCTGAHGPCYPLTVCFISRKQLAVTRSHQPSAPEMGCGGGRGDKKSFLARWLVYPHGHVKPNAWVMPVHVRAWHRGCQWLLRQLVWAIITQHEVKTCRARPSVWAKPNNVAELKT